MAALILAMRLSAVSLSLWLSRDVLLRGVSTGETLGMEVGAEVVLEVDCGAVLVLLPPLPPAAATAAADGIGAWLEDPLALRKASSAIVWVCRQMRTGD